jgi:RHS repeat-associated protein
MRSAGTTIHFKPKRQCLPVDSAAGRPSPSASGCEVMIMVRKKPCASTVETFYVDNVGISYQSTSTQPVLVKAGYQYGFNGQEKDNEVMGEGNSYTAEFWNYDVRLGRRWNTDPVVKPHESPYAILANNPIWFIDPNGADTVEVFKGTGDFHSHTKAKGDDVFFIVEKDDEGNINRLNQISFDEGTLGAIRRPKFKTSKRSGEKVEAQLTLFEIEGDENAQKLFEFFVDPTNTNVEFTHAKVGTESSGRNVVGTAGFKHSTPVGAYLRVKNYIIRESIHNHPNGVAYPSDADQAAAKQYHERNGRTILKIYTHPNNYQEYDENGLKNSLPSFEFIGGDDE